MPRNTLLKKKEIGPGVKPGHFKLVPGGGQGAKYGGYIARDESWHVIGEEVRGTLQGNEEVRGICVNIVNPDTNESRWMFYSDGVSNKGVAGPDSNEDTTRMKIENLTIMRINPDYYPLPGGDTICVP